MPTKAQMEAKILELADKLDKTEAANTILFNRLTTLGKLVGETNQALLAHVTATNTAYKQHLDFIQAVYERARKVEDENTDND